MSFEIGERKTTIQKKLVCIVLGVIFSALLVANILQGVVSYTGLRSDAKKELVMIARVANRDLQHAISALDRMSATQALHFMAYQSTMSRACVYDVDGQLFADYIKTDKQAALLGDATVEGCPKSARLSDGQGFWRGIHLVVPIERDGKKWGALRLDYHLDEMHALFLRDRLYGFAIMLVAMVLAYFAIIATQQVITRPIVYLSKVAAALGETKDFSIRAQKYSNDETGVLVDTFNAMLDGLETRDKELVQARYEANVANELKGQFLATMSHEIRTPMTGVLGMAELLLGSHLDKRQKGHVQTIVSSAESLLNIINDILDFSKIEAGKMELEYMPIDLFELVDEIGVLYSVQAREKAVELVVHYLPGTEQFVFADPVRLRQIISNLLNNAIKFTEQGHIVLSVEENKQAGLPRDRAELVFKVKDTGVGIPLNLQEKIFTKFSQADTSTTRKFGGTGLGLAICKNLLDMMGGEITVESRAGKGATFSVAIPFARNTTITQRAPVAVPLRGVRFIIVDDLQVNLQLIREQLESVGAICDTALSGEDALRKMEQASAANKPYQVGIIDYLMPDMNGEMLACAIKDHAALHTCCLVMLTAAGSPIAPQDYVNKGFSAHIAKPVQQELFLEALCFVWSRYQEGHTSELIRYEGQDTRTTDTDENMKLEGVKVLMAEDNLVNQAFIQEILEEMDCDLRIAQNGQEALDALKDNQFALVLMDCLMPVMDGFEAARAICKLKNEGKIDKNLPIVALTANAMKGDRDKCLAAGMNDYLSKPVRKKELKEMVHKWVRHNGQSEGGQGAITAKKAVDNDLLDSEAVASARDILKGKYDAMVGVYIDGSREKIDEITKALEANDMEALIRPAHTLKSTSRQMGAVKISDVAMDIEVAAKAMIETKAGNDDNEGALHDIGQRAATLSALLEDTEKAFHEMG